MPFFFFIITALISVAHSSDDELLQRLSKDQQWLNLVHYKKTIFGKLESQADGPLFFLHKKGKADPVAELATTIALFREAKSPLKEDSAVCRFPARYIWLQKYFPEFNLAPSAECTSYREFKEKSNAHSVSLVFSSYFINTPASAFGHTFLRLNSSPHRDDNQDQGELLDYGISYAAKMDDDPAILYAIKGLAGMYRGYFSAVPYYYKVREYNDFEFRDLWEYKLRFTPAQIEMIVAHIWELEPTWFEYLYFTENCAYHVLGVLEVGDPALKLTDPLPDLFVIPVDTLRVAADSPNLIVGRRYRPSVLSRLEWQSAELQSDEVTDLRDLVEGDAANMTKILARAKNDETRARMLETAVDGYDFLNARELIFKPKETIPDRYRLLVARSELDVILPEVQQTPTASEWPDRGHRSQRWNFGVGYQSSEGFYSVGGMRFSLHDLLDPLAGQPTFSQIIFGDFNARIQQSDYSRVDSIRLENADIFRISSFQPITHWQRNTSWDGRVGVRTVREEGCDECLMISTEAGIGATVAPKLSESFVALLNKFHLDYSDGFEKPWRIGVGPEMWGRWVPNRYVSMLGIVGYKWRNHFEQPFFARQSLLSSLEFRYHATKDYSLYLKGDANREQRSGIVGLNRFF